MRTVSADTTLVTITVGGNDTGVRADPGRLQHRPRRRDLPARHPGRGARRPLDRSRRADLDDRRCPAAGPRGEDPGPGLPATTVEPGPDCDVPGVPNAVRREALNRAADTLDAALADAAGRFRGQFVDVRAAFAGHGVCSAADPWITPPPASAPAIYHPTPQGYRDGYLPAFEAAVTRP